MLRKNDTPEDCQTAVAVLDSAINDQYTKIENWSASTPAACAGKIIGQGLIAIAKAISAIAFAILAVGLLWVKHKNSLD
jgi:hypothetical protein